MPTSQRPLSKNEMTIRQQTFIWRGFKDRFAFGFITSVGTYVVGMRALPWILEQPAAALKEAIAVCKDRIIHAQKTMDASK